MIVENYYYKAWTWCRSSAFCQQILMTGSRLKLDDLGCHSEICIKQLETVNITSTSGFLLVSTDTKCGKRRERTLIAKDVSALLFWNIIPCRAYCKYQQTSTVWMQTTHHLNHFWVNCFCYDSSVLCDIFNHLIQGSTFYLFPFQITQGVLHKVKQHCTLSNFLNK